MVFILKLLHGAYAYLLMFQIGIIGVLTLMLLWLIVRRTKMQVLGPSHAVTMVQVEGPADFSKSAEYQLMQSRINSFEAERTSYVAMKNDYDALQQKVKFLESKLLEYEILQEEIGTLSSLKVENERLKKEVNSLQTEVGSRQRQFSNDAAAVVEATGPVVAPSAETTSLPNAPEPAVEIESIALMSNSLVDGPNTEPPPQVATATTPEPASPDLDSLLKEIDALTGTDQAPKS